MKKVEHADFGNLVCEAFRLPVVVAVVAAEFDQRRVAFRSGGQIAPEDGQPLGHGAAHAGAVVQPQSQSGGRRIGAVPVEQGVPLPLLVIDDAAHHAVAPYGNGFDLFHFRHLLLLISCL